MKYIFIHANCIAQGIVLLRSRSRFKKKIKNLVISALKRNFKNRHVLIPYLFSILVRIHQTQ